MYEWCSRHISKDKLMNEGQAILSIQHLLALLTIIPGIPKTFLKDRKVFSKIP